MRTHGNYSRLLWKDYRVGLMAAQVHKLKHLDNEPYFATKALLEVKRLERALANYKPDLVIPLSADDLP